MAQTIASFAFGLIPGAALGIILVCLHARPSNHIDPGVSRSDVFLGALPFLIGPALLVATAFYGSSTWDFSPAEIGLTVGIASGLIATYGFLYFYAVRHRDR